MVVYINCEAHSPPADPRARVPAVLSLEPWTAAVGGFSGLPALRRVRHERALAS
jgi:hypothetical protein